MTTETETETTIYELRSAAQDDQLAIAALGNAVSNIVEHPGATQAIRNAAKLLENAARRFEERGMLRAGHDLIQISIAALAMADVMGGEMVELSRIKIDE